MTSFVNRAKHKGFNNTYIHVEITVLFGDCKKISVQTIDPVVYMLTPF